MFDDSPAYKSAFRLTEKERLTQYNGDIEEEAQHRRLDFIRLQRGSIEYAEIKGMEKGRKEGREEAREETKLAIAQRLLASGMSPRQAADITGIAIERLG